jgi:AmmeMemoRadiSam system protein B
MDYARGNVTYGFGFKELFEATAARLFVVVATSHYSPARFTLSRQHFATPLGTVETDQGFVDRVMRRYGDGLFDDPAAHVPEHSIELELPPLQFLYDGAEPVRIVPLLVGSFGECVEEKRPPAEDADVRRMADALAAAEAEAGEPVCYLISGDLAHIGPKFDDPVPLDDARLGHSRGQDERLLESLMRADADGYFRVIADEGDERRICGLPPTYLTLLAAKPNGGRVLHYQQYVHPQGHESVSFAAAALYG